jgi:hypothetical protein
MAIATATVEVLTAEVRVLMVGSRQVTLSVYRQLDETLPECIEPFGRVKDAQDAKKEDHHWDSLYVIGRDHHGRLAWASLTRKEGERYSYGEDADSPNMYVEWLKLPLIVLAGLR